MPPQNFQLNNLTGEGRGGDNDIRFSCNWANIAVLHQKGLFKKLGGNMDGTITKAFDAWHGNYISISNKELEWDELHSNLPNPETMLIIKEEFSHLSVEAQEVVGLIYNAPYTIFQLMTTQKRENLTIASIEAFLISSGWSKKRIARVFRELKTFAKNL